MYLKVILTSLLLTLSSSSLATDIAVCNSCSESNLKTEAQGAVPDQVGTHFIYGMDLINNRARYYQAVVSDIGVVGSNGKPLLAKVLTIVPANSGFVSAVSSASQEVTLRQSQGIDIPATTGLTSASDMIDKSWATDVVNNYFADNYPFTFWSVGAISAYGSLLVGPLEGLKLRVRFSDGSKAEIMAPSIKDTVWEFAYVWNSAVDQDGNAFPASENEFAGKSFIFDIGSTDTFSWFVERSASMGVTFVSESNGGGCNNHLQHRIYTCSSTSTSTKCTFQGCI